ncbi:WXG100 family type VII secretion target [Nocardia sp. NBC_01730]|uniref:WXG100 family type VII secretion target n=1 Tax=Nocardia sp. NBC_01730 TaxID=2975998 RepID=UPI002E0D83C4|nr:WXG100 family type VII secretion target [Nocardia sp. NBC_01730]
MGDVNFEEFGAQGVADDMGDAISALRTTINRVVETTSAAKAGWQGDASDACGKAASAFEDEADRVKAILQEITDMVGDGNKGYKEMEADNTDFFTNLSV